MEKRYWQSLSLKDGSEVYFVPPAPNGEQLGGITQAEREQIEQLREDYAQQIELLKQVRDALKNSDINDAIGLLDSFLLDKEVLA